MKLLFAKYNLSAFWISAESLVICNSLKSWFSNLFDIVAEKFSSLRSFLKKQSIKITFSIPILLFFGNLFYFCK
jgi:hypothetical protein